MAGAIRNPVLRFVVYSHLWLALGAAAQTWWMGELMNVPSWSAPTLAFCGTLVLYTFMRLARMNHPQLGPSSPLIWFRQHHRVMIAMAVVSAVAGGIVGLPFARSLVRTLWPAALIAFLYVVPLGFAGGKTIGLRRLPGMKAFLIAVVWAMITVGLPCAIAGRALFGDPGAWFFTLQFSFVLALDIAFDVRDLPHDMKSLYTLPQLIGAPAAKSFAVLFVLPWLLFLFIAMVISYGPIEPGWRAAQVDLGLLFPAIGFLIAAFLVARARPERDEAYYTFFMDGTFILIPLLAWIGSLL